MSRTEARRRGFAFGYNGNTVSFGSLLGGLVSPPQGQVQPGAGVGIRNVFNPFSPTGTANLVFTATRRGDRK